MKKMKTDTKISLTMNIRSRVAILKVLSSEVMIMKGKIVGYLFN